MSATRPLELFISYAHQDDVLRTQLEAHLALLKRQGVFDVWHDRRISAGAEWAGEIDRALESADVVLLLVSADFLNSDYCYDKEMARALIRHEEGATRVVPVILRSCDWQSSPFGKLEALPVDGKPVMNYPSVDAAFTEIAGGLRALATEIRSGARAADAHVIVDTPTHERRPPPLRKTLKIGPIKFLGVEFGRVDVAWPPRPRALGIGAVVLLGVAAAYFQFVLSPLLRDAQNALRRADYATAATRIHAMPEWSSALPFVARLAAVADFGIKLAQGTPIRGLTPELAALGKRYPDSPDVLVFEGLKAYYVDQDAEKARQRFTEAADRDAAHVEAHFLAVGRDIDLAYIAMSRDDMPGAQAADADARRLVHRATSGSAFAAALPRYASEIGSLDTLEGDDIGAYAVYERLLSADPQSALEAAFVSWRLPQASATAKRSLEGLEQAMRLVEKDPHSADGWSFRVAPTELVDVRPKDEKLCLLAWAYDLSSALQPVPGADAATTEGSLAEARQSCRVGALAARTREIVCVQVLNAEHALLHADARQPLFESWRTNHLRCEQDLEALPVLPARSPAEAKRSARAGP